MVVSPDARSTNFAYLEHSDVENHPHLREKKEQISLGLLLLLSIPRIAIAIASVCYWGLLPRDGGFFAIFTGPLAGLLVAPIVGTLSDRCTSIYGRRRPFLVVGAIMMICSWTLMAQAHELGEVFGDNQTHRRCSSILTLIFYFLMDISVNIINIPSHLLIADFAGDRQIFGASLGNAAGIFGNIVVTMYVYFWGAAIDSIHTFLGMISILVTFAIALLTFMVKEVPLTREEAALTFEEDNASKSQMVLKALKAVYAGFFYLPQQLKVLFVLVVLAFYGIMTAVRTKSEFFGSIVYAGTENQANICSKTNSCSPAQVAYNAGVLYASGSLDIVFHLSAYIFAWILPFVVAKLGIRRTICVAFTMQISFALMALVSSKILSSVIVVGSSVSLSTIMGLLVPTAIEVLGTSRQHELGYYVGILNSAICLGQILNLIVSEATAGTSMGYRVPIFVSGAVAAIGCSLTVLLFKVTKTKVKRARY